MPMIRHEVTTSILRFYEQESTASTPPFDATCVVQWETPRIVWLKAFHGRLTRGLLRCLLKWLADNGIRTVRAYRDAAHHLPFGQVQDDGSTVIDVADLLARFARRSDSTWGSLP